MKKVCVIGHFGFGENLLNGQTIKTKIVTNELDKQFGADQVVKIDTHGGAKALPSVVFQMIKAFRECDNIIIFPAHNGIQIFVPLCNSINVFFHRRLHYVVIGGWLPEFLNRHHSLSKKLKIFHKIYVETHNMKRLLEKIGFENIAVMPNCKRLNIVSKPEQCTKPYLLCTFSRVMKEKGIEDAVNAVISANKELGAVVYHLDIYGQIDSNQTEWFTKLQKTFPDYINYRGLVKFDESVEVLKPYFALLFPTYYEGEGFAGTAIDAFSAGVPVLASNWKYNNEVIKDGINGGLVEPKNVERLTKYLINIANNPESWLNMRKQCISDARTYEPDNVMKTLLQEII